MISLYRLYQKVKALNVLKRVINTMLDSSLLLKKAKCKNIKKKRSSLVREHGTDLQRIL